MNGTEPRSRPIDQRPLSYKHWALYIFLAGLPLVGLILLLIWAFSSDGNVNRREWAKGMLLIYVILTVFSILILLIFGLGIYTVLGTQQ